MSGVEGMTGTDAVFTIKVEGDMLTLTGEVKGTPLKETWKRID